MDVESDSADLVHQDDAGGLIQEFSEAYINASVPELPELETAEGSAEQEPLALRSEQEGAHGSILATYGLWPQLNIASKSTMKRLGTAMSDHVLSR